MEKLKQQGMDRNQKLAEIAKAIEQGSTPEPITVRTLLDWFGVQRRGTNVIEQIRKQLLGFGLVTSPPFESAWINETISFVQASDGEGPPSPGWARHLQRIVDQLDRNEQPDPITVRTLLDWFGAERRGSYTAHRIEDALSEFNLKTEPDFKSIYIDAKINLIRIGSTNTPDATSDTQLEPSLPLVPKHMQSPSTEPPPAETPVQTAPPPEPIQAQPEASPNETTAESIPETDPSFRIGTLKTSNLEAVQKKLIRTNPNATITEAVTLMMTHSISHLPVMQNDRGTVKGVITWQSIARYLAIRQGSPSDEVRHCMDSARETNPDAHLFDVINDIVNRGHIFIRSGDNKLTGIVTPSDLSTKFRESAEPFLLLSEIENYARSIVRRGKFTIKELEAAREAGDSRTIEGAHNLTLGELIRLLQPPQNWDRIGVAIDRKQIIDNLNEVRIIRNEVMHFRLDDVTGEKTDLLRRVARFFQELRNIKAI